MRSPPIAGSQIVTEARQWVGRPFAHQGRSQWGVDCIGLVICVRHAVRRWNAGMASERDYARNPTDKLLLALEAHLTPIDAPEAGCVAAIAWHRQTIVSHVGILTPDTIIHAYQSAGRVVETGYRGHWQQWTKSLWRLPGVGA